MENEFAKLLQEEQAGLKTRDQQAACPTEERWTWAARYHEAEEVDLELNELRLITDESETISDKLKAANRIIDISLDSGDFDQARNTLKACIVLSPSDAALYRRLGQLLEEMGHSDEAAEAYRSGYEATGDIALLKLSRQNPKSSEKVEIEGNETEQGWPSTSGDAFRLLDLCNGREGVYARQWISRTGETGYTPVQEALTPHLVMQHFIGRHTLGVYQIRTDQTVSFIAFDIDCEALESPAVNRGDLPARYNCCSETIEALVSLFNELGLDPVLEDSGNKGFHIWLFLDTPLKAGTARTFGKLVVDCIPRIPAVNIEIFPKQSQVRTGGLGNLIKMPLGIHRQTGNMSRFLELDMSKPANMREFLHSIPKTPRGRVLKSISLLEGRKEDAKGPRITETVPFEASHSILSEPEYVPENDQQLHTILENCELLRTLYAKARGTGQLNGDERTVLVHTLGHLEHGPEIVNPLLEQAGIPANERMKRGHRGYPMGCAKIAKRLHQLASSVECHCSFDSTRSEYPHPLLHLEKGKQSPMSRGLSLEQLVMEYMKVRREISRLYETQETLERRLVELFETAGTNQVSLPQGKLRLLKDEQGNPSFQLEI